MILDDLTGQKFGKLTVVERDNSKREAEKKRVAWICRCECGNVCSVYANNLKNGHTTSCGCAKTNDLTGRRFGRLMAQSRVERPGSRYSWYNCVCDCGNACVVRADSLTSSKGGARSCGCYASDVHSAAAKKQFISGTQPSAIRLNKEPGKANKSGIVGVNWDKSRNMWQASIRFKGRKYNLGRYNNIEDAAAARRKAELEIYKPFIDGQKYKGGAAQ